MPLVAKVSAIVSPLKATVKVTGLGRPTVNVKYGPISVTSGGGTPWSSGSGAPSGGANGDFYLRTSNLHIYEKIAGTWTDMGQLVPTS